MINSFLKWINIPSACPTHGKCLFVIHGCTTTVESQQKEKRVLGKQVRSTKDLPGVFLDSDQLWAQLVFALNNLRGRIYPATFLA